jgi:hypothetical protein
VRGWAGWMVTGCAAALACRGDWAAAGVAAGCVVLPVAWRVRGALAATREELRAYPPAGRHRRRGRPRELPGLPCGDDRDLLAAGVQGQRPRA